jgi:hypothetical protein
MSDQPDFSERGAPLSRPTASDQLPDSAEKIRHTPRTKHRARIEHKVRGRIRMKIPHARINPEILEIYRAAFSAIPGVHGVDAKADSGSIIIRYDPNREQEFERHLHNASTEHLHMAEPAPPDDEIDKLAGKIEAEAEFLAAHSNFARSTVDFCKAFDRELKLATGNNVDLKIVLAVGLAAYTFLEIGGTAATPMWVTLALFSLNHFVELHTDHRVQPVPAQPAATA